MPSNNQDPELGVDDVAGVLATHGISVQVLSSDTSTAVLAADALQTDVAAIVKSLVFMHDGTPVLALVSGTRTVNLALLAERLGAESVRLARPREVRELTGYAVGGVPPIAHRQPLRVVMDRHLVELPHVYAAAGSRVAVFEIQPDELIRISRAEVGDFAE